MSGVGEGEIPDDRPAIPDVFSATSLADIRASLAELSSRETSITFRLDALVASQHELQHDLNRLDLLRTQLDAQVLNTKAISDEMLYTPASTANRITASVGKIDLEQSRIKATLEAVDQVSELKRCVQGVVDSMGGPQDWETAARYIDRASKIPKDVLLSPYAQEIVPTIETPDAPDVTLRNASEALCKLFTRDFDNAVQTANGSKITRFFKLFPLIGRSEVGLAAYGRYVCQGVGTRARTTLSNITSTQKKEARSYSLALTRLFEHIAQIVDAHGPLVEKHYGAGMMAAVTEKLQIEADIQGGIILDTWSDEKDMTRKMTEVKSYAFTFLVQSFLVNSKLPNRTPRSTSPALSAQSRKSEADDGAIEMAEIFRVVNEAGLMLSRWSLYSRFLAQHIGSHQGPPDTRDESPADTPSPPSPLHIPAFLKESALHEKVAGQLIQPFNILVVFYFRRSLERAFQLDESPTFLSISPASLSKPLPSNPPYTTSSVDDTMYIISNLLNLVLSTSQITVVTSVLPTMTRMLQSDYIGMTQRRMRDECYPRATMTPHGQILMPPEDKIIQFIVLCNSLELSISYLLRLVSSRLSPPIQAQKEGSDNGSQAAIPTVEDLFPFDGEVDEVKRLLTSLHATFSQKGSELLSDGLAVLFNNVTKPRLRTVIADAFQGVSYSNPAQLNNIQQDDAEDANPDLVVHRFERSWSNLTKPLERIMTPGNYSRLLQSTVSHLSRVLQKRIWAFGYTSSSFPNTNGSLAANSSSHYSGKMTSKSQSSQGQEKLSQLGSLRLERDVSRIVDVVARGGRYSIRTLFGRCIEIMRIANLEVEEWEEMLRGSDRSKDGAPKSEDEEGGDKWQLDWEERAKARGLVVAG